MDSAPIFDTSPSELLLDLYHAYKDARRHKRSRDYQLRFERNAESELVRLRDAILSKRYRPGASTCFIIHDPKMREVFAAQFRNRLDFPLVKYLLEVIVLDYPTHNCRRKGSLSDWEGLPDSKSLFHSPEGCGLPIGNLTSQLFSNVYMDLFDKYMVSLVGKGRYGRYVDDAYVVGENKAELRRIILLAESFLQTELGLSLSRNKIAIFSAYRGVEFLGAYLKPFRRYVGNKCLMRMFNPLIRFSG